ncbi:MAG TPA: choice-of-anchor Q domain-containing protein [Candidatus Acidoferrales bacterium]|nr:choice-of-anchor Q domain-containing protein [Candidatus Acidoferrales bacterium]
MIRIYTNSTKSVLAALVVGVLLAASPVFGSTFTVTNTNDSGAGSLRDAIATASDGDTINFSLPYPATITVLSPLTVSHVVNIIGPGASNLAISGGDAIPVFQITAGVFTTPVRISGVTIEHGHSVGSSALSSNGGGIINARVLVLDSSIISANVADGFGGGIYNTGLLTLSNTTVNNNSAGLGGGGIKNGSPGLPTSLTIINSTISSNTTPKYGGGIHTDGELDLKASTISNNSAGLSGGGIYQLSRVNASKSTISGNVANNNNHDLQGGGGGIFNSNAVLTLDTSTISENVAVGLGGGINNLAFTNIINSTISANAAVNGGGIYNNNQLTLSNSTVYNNGSISFGIILGTVPSTTTASQSSGFGIQNDAYVTVKNTIVVLSSCQSLFSFGISSQGHNLSDASCPITGGTGDIIPTNPGIDPTLANNGGPTQTLALQTGSPAVDAIPLGYCTDVNLNPVKTDQRGVPRPQGSACDIGAYELFVPRFFPIQVIGTLILIGSVETSPITPGTQQGLIAPLGAAVDFMNNGDVIQATYQLGAFIRESTALVQGGVVPPDQLDPLITSASQIIQSLSPPAISP